MSIEVRRLLVNHKRRSAYENASKWSILGITWAISCWNSHQIPTQMMNPYPYITWFINFTMWISFATWINTATFAMYVALLIEPTNTGMHSIQIWCTLTVQKITIYNMNHHYCRNQRLRSSEQPLINLLCAAHNWVLLLCARTAHNKVFFIACLVQYVDAHSKTKDSLSAIGFYCMYLQHTIRFFLLCVSYSMSMHTVKQKDSLSAIGFYWSHFSKYFSSL